MKKISLYIAILFLLGCSTVTTIELPEGDSVIVKSRNGSLVKVSRANTIIEVDKRGRASFIEQLVSMVFMKSDWINNKVEE